MTQRPIAGVMASLLEDLGPLMRFFLESRWAQRQGAPDIADFVAGNPHDPPLSELTEALQRWAVPGSNDWFAYKLNEPAAQQAVATSLQRSPGIRVEPQDVALTPGTFGALSVAMRTITDPGDEIVYVSPPWFFYAPMIRVAGAVPVRVAANPPAFDLPVEGIAAALTERTRAVIINSPNNPCGNIYPPEQLAALGDVLRDASRRAGRTIYLLSDESYRRIVFDDAVFHSPAPHYDATMVLYTYGKALLAPGERIGYVALPATMPARGEVRDAMLLAQITGGWQFPNATLQYALPELEDVTVDIPRLQARRDRLVEALGAMGYELRKPAGTFYLLPRSPLRDDTAFVEMLADHDVFVLPGQAFDLPGWFRISVTGNDEMIDRALPGFEKALAAARE